MTARVAPRPATRPGHDLGGVAAAALALLPAVVLLVSSVSADMVAIAGRDPAGVWHVLPAGPVGGSWLNAEVSSTFLLLVAIALFRAKRAGYWLAIAVLLAAIVAQGAFHHDLVGAAVAAVLAAVLVATRARYVVRTGRQDVVIAASLLGVGAAIVALDGLWPGGVGGSSRPERLLTAWLDGGSIGRLSLASGLAASLVIARVASIAAVAMLLDPAQDPRDTATRERARRALRRFGRGALLPYAFDPPCEPFATADADGVLAYARAGHTAIALGDPAGAPDASLRCWDDWLELCRLSDWGPAIYQASGAFRAILVERGWQALKVGSEAVIDPVAFDPSTPRLANLRHTVTRARKGGLSAYVSDGSSARLPAAAAPARLAALDAEWSATAGPQLGFTVGRFDPSALADCVVAVAIDATDHLAAFVVLRPSGADGGWMLDLMRRRRDGVPGAVELCVTAAIEVLAANRVRRLSLGLAPLARLDGRTGPLPERALAAAARAVRPIYDVGGLAFFKDKFAPSWEDRYLAVPRLWMVPGAGLALLWLHLGGSWRAIARSISGGIAGTLRLRGRSATA